MSLEARDAYGITDAARRCAEQVTLHVLAGATGRWCAVRMSDGGSDGIAYDTRDQAIRHQLHVHQCVYVVVPLLPMAEAEAQAYLDMWRDLYDQGVRLGHEGDKDPMVPIRMENMKWTR